MRLKREFPPAASILLLLRRRGPGGQRAQNQEPRRARVNEQTTKGTKDREVSLQDAEAEVRRTALWAWVESGERMAAGQVGALYPPKQTETKQTYGLLFSLWNSGYRRSPL